eukprot:jgi/Phyca11/18330/fgenesh1_pg.PHYCAscaffold_35_\
MHIRGKEKLEEMRRHYEEELHDTPLEAQKEIDRLKEIQQDTLKLVYAAGDSILDLLQVSLRKADHSVQNQTLEKINFAQPSDSLIQWLNFQRRRGAEMGSVRLKDKKKEFKPIKFLQDLRAVIASPGVMLKLLCHTSSEAQAEYDRIQSTELSNTAASVAAENSTTATTLSASAQVQLRSYFKIIPGILNLPPDIVTRDSFVLNDFDSLYAYAVYLYLFHPNYVAPGMLLSLCESEDEFHKIEQVYKDNVLDLIKIFRIYGSAAGGKGILEQEFLKVMTKAGVTNKKNILRSHLQIIYQQSRQPNGGIPPDNPNASGNSAPVSTPGEGEEDAEDRGATPNEFFEALTRVAYHNYQKRREFMGQIATMMNMGDEVSMETINGSGSLLFDFESMLKDRRLIDALFPHGKIKQLVAFVQQDGEIGNAASSINGYDADSEFVFSEFVEALSAIAVYRNANPYLPFAKKLETFFEEYF